MFCSSPPVDVNAVQKSWNGIKSSLGDKAPEAVGKLVFENLFRDYPEMAEFFKQYGPTPEDIINNKKFMYHAKERVFKTFDKVVNQLGNEAEINNITSWLAQVHVTKGVKTSDYLNLGNAILKSLEQALGKDMTLELKASWSAALVNMMSSIGAHQLQK